MKFREAIFRRFVISYLLVTILPVSFLSAYIFIDFSRTTKDNFINKNYNILETAATQIEKDIIELRQLVISMSSDSILLKAKAGVSDYNAIEITDRLQRYKSANGKIKDIAVYTQNSEQVYAATGCYRDLDFYYRIAFNTQPDMALFSEFRNHTVPEIVKGANDRHYGIIYSYPYTGETYGYVIFSFACEVFEEVLQSAIITDRGEEFLVIDRNNNIFAATGHRYYEQICGIINDNPGVARYSSFEGNSGSKYLVSFFRPSGTGNAYVIVSPKKIIDVNSKIYYLLILVFITTLIGLLGIWYQRRISYLPLKKITNKIISNTNRRDLNIDDLTMEVEKAFDDNRRLSNLVKDEHPMIQNQLMLKLLAGNIEDIRQLSEIADILKDKETIHNYAVVLVKCEEEFDMSTDFSYTAPIEIAEDAKIYYVDTYLSDMMVFIVSITAKNADIYGEILKEIYNYFNNKLQMTVSISAGQIKEELSEISVSYSEAMKGIESRFVVGHGSIICYEDVGPLDSNIKPIYLDIEEFSKYLILGNKENVRRLIADLIVGLKSLNVRMAKNVCYDIVNSIIKVINGLRIDFKKSLDRCYVLIMETESLTIEEISDEILNVCDDICDRMTERREDNTVQLFKQIKQYVDDNLFKPDFSLSDVADRFGISYSYLSRFFKSQFNMNMRDYITKQRINYAKQLLRDTNMQISEIVKLTGYIDVSSFNRRFKATEGCSPTEWIKLNKN